MKGKVVDEFNNPMPFVTVFLENTTHGTSTNDAGSFFFKTTKNKGVLDISFVGFETQKITVNKQTKYLNIVLKEDKNQLDEVIIVTKPKKRLKKKENPAYRILKEIWKRKRKNGLDLVDYYQYKKHRTIEIGLNNLDSMFLKKVFKNDYQKTIKKVRYDSDGINLYIPIYLNEQITNIYGDTKNNHIREDIEAEKTDGIGTQGFVYNRMSNSLQDFDIFKNNITLFKKSFISPLSTDGFGTYDYVLYDSIVKNNKKSYNIYFFPIRDGDLAFQGNFWVSDKNFAIQKLKMKVQKSVIINFIRGLTFEKEFKIINDSVYIPTKNTYEADFTFVDKKDNKKGLTIKKNIFFEKHIFDKPLNKNFYTQEITKVRPNQYAKDTSYWKSQRNEKQISSTYDFIKEVKEKRRIKNVTGIINTISLGYINTKYNIQFGHLWSVFSRNAIEGFRTQLGFRTFKTKDDRFRLRTYVARGFKDNKYKYGIQARYLLSYLPRISLGASYQKDIGQLGRTQIRTTQLLTGRSNTLSLLSRNNNFSLSQRKKVTTNFDYQVQQNFHIGVNLSHSKTQSASPSNFSMDYFDENGNTQSGVIDTSSEMYVAFSPGRFVYGLGVQREFGDNIFPSLILNYRRGYKGVFNGTHDYSKLQFRYKHPILLSKFGVLETTVEVGKTFGTVPLALLNILPVNNSISISRNTFSLVNSYDFVADTYLTTYLEHHFNGFIMNRIPLLNKLKLRSLATFRAAYGTISDKNLAINNSNIRYNAPNDIYYEYSVGLENIGYRNLRFLRVDAIWRSNYTPPKGTVSPPTPKFAVRVGINLGLL